MKIINNRILLTLASIIITGCTLPPKPFDHNAEEQSVNSNLVCASRIDIQPISINGAQPPVSSFDFSMNKLKKYTTNNIVVHPIINLTMQARDANRFVHHFQSALNGAQILSYQEDQALRDKLRSFPRAKTSIIMIYTPDLHDSWDNSSEVRRGLAFGYSSYHPINVVAYNQTKINQAPVISNTQSWKIVLTHELGHRLGVPAARSHNQAGHCSRRECVMYQKPDFQSVVSVLFNGMPYDFGKLGQEELAAAKRRCASR